MKRIIVSCAMLLGVLGIGVANTGTKAPLTAARTNINDTTPTDSTADSALAYATAFNRQFADTTGDSTMTDSMMTDSSLAYASLYSRQYSDTTGDSTSTTDSSFAFEVMRKYNNFSDTTGDSTSTDSTLAFVAMR